MRPGQALGKCAADEHNWHGFRAVEVAGKSGHTRLQRPQPYLAISLLCSSICGNGTTCAPWTRQKASQFTPLDCATSLGCLPTGGYPYERMPKVTCRLLRYPLHHIRHPSVAGASHLPGQADEAQPGCKRPRGHHVQPEGRSHAVVRHRRHLGRRATQKRERVPVPAAGEQQRERGDLVAIFNSAPKERQIQA